MADLIINDTNFNTFINPPPGQSKGLLPRRSMCGALPFAKILTAEDIPIVPRVEWPDRIADMERDKSRISDLAKQAGIQSFDQNGTNYCHANSPTLAIMILRAVMGLPFVLLSPGSVGGPVTGFRNLGAAIEDDLEVITRLGCASQEFVPPNQISKSGWKPGAEENALLHKVDEWFDLPSGRTGQSTANIFDVEMSLLFARIPVCVAHYWWSHATTACDPVMPRKGVFGIREWNSWGNSYGDQGLFILEEGKARPDEGYAPRTTGISLQ